MTSENPKSDAELMSPQEIASEAKRRALQQESARRNLIDFTQYMFPRYVADPFHKLLASKLDDVLNNKIHRLMFFSPPQHGKECAHSTPVFTPTGWRCHGDILPGDMVYGRDGKPVLVLAIGDETVDKVEVEFTDGAKIKCHPNHEWVVFDRTKQGGGRSESESVVATRLLDNVRLGPEGRGGRYRWQVDANVSLDGCTQDLLLPPYFLGAWLGDGTSILPRITTGIQDEDSVIGRIEKDGIRRTGRHPNKTYDGRSIQHEFTHQGVLEKLRQLGVYHNKHIPKQYLIANLSQRLDLLAGLMDTDGFVYHKNGRCGFSNINQTLINDFADLVRTLGWRVTLSTEEPKLTTSGIQGRHPVTTASFNPTYSWPAAVERKFPRKLDPVNRRRAIVAIRKCDPEPGRCLQVEGGVYLVGPTCIPTHNSLITSVHFPAFWLANRPDDPLMIASYGADLAQDKSAEARQVVESSRFKLLFPHIKTDDSSRAVDHWKIAGHMGALRAAGVGGGITGFPAKLIVIDDPYRDAKDANSELIRENVRTWYRQACRTRLAENGAIVILTTRWNEDDLCGTLLRENPGDWEVVRCAAIAETPAEREQSNTLLGLPLDTPDPLGRQPGEPLAPSLHSLQDLQKLRHEVLELAWAGMYQGVPRNPEGNRFKRAWFEVVTDIPPMSDYIRAWDKAATPSNRDGCFTVGLLMGRSRDARFYVIDMVRGQWTPHERQRVMLTTAQRDHEVYEGRVQQWIEREPGSGGLESAAEDVRLLAGYPVYIDNVSGQGSKEIRAQPMEAQAQAGNVKIRRASWSEIWIDEVCCFPLGRFMDIVDASACALNKLAHGARSKAPDFIQLPGIGELESKNISGNVDRQRISYAIFGKQGRPDRNTRDGFMGRRQTKGRGWNRE